MDFQKCTSLIGLTLNVTKCEIIGEMSPMTLHILPPQKLFDNAQMLHLLLSSPCFESTELQLHDTFQREKLSRITRARLGSGLLGKNCTTFNY